MLASMRRGVAVAVCAGVCNLVACQILAGLDDPLVPRPVGDGGNVGADVVTSADGAPVDGGADAPVVLGPPVWRKASTTGPSPRHSTTLAYDQVRERVVLFGGWIGTRDDDETWEWDGTSWSERTLPTSPNGRRGHRMASDTARKRVLLFGGTRTFPPDQWEWDGLRWTQMSSTNHPPAAQSIALVYDSARAVSVTFGGQTFGDAGTGMIGETWEWNGTDWTHRLPANAPSPRRATTLAYDSARQRVVLFGGRSGNGPENDTWEYDGTNWAERTPINFPSARFGACTAYDPRRRVTVLFGGWDGSSRYDETWFWDGNDWSPGPKGPPAIQACALTYDPARGNLVLFGGAFEQAAVATRSLGDTWVLE